METSPERIHRILENQFSAALQRRNRASAAFEEVHREISSGLPHPDGVQRIIDTSKELAVAMAELRRCVSRIADFEVRGIVPDDLENSCGNLTSNGSIPG